MRMIKRTKDCDYSIQENKPWRYIYTIGVTAICVVSLIWGIVWCVMAVDLRDKVILLENENESLRQYVGSLEQQISENEYWFERYIELGIDCGANE